MGAMYKSMQVALTNETKYRAKRALHSIICKNMSLIAVTTLFPSINKDEYYRSVNQGKTLGVGIEAKFVKPRRKKFVDARVTKFVQFMLQVSTTLPYGHKMMKYSGGEVAQVPLVKRNLNRTDNIARYKETFANEATLSNST